jgi:hypothetical protein
MKWSGLSRDGGRHGKSVFVFVDGASVFRHGVTC